MAIDLVSGFAESLLLVMALAAVGAGRRMYLAAVAGLGLLLYARIADGFIPDSVRLGLTVAGLVVAGLTVVADILFEVVPEGEPEPGPPV